MINCRKYDDIINLTYPRPTLRPRMSALDRAAQFSPFAALTGHGAAINETARLTEERIELDECEKAAIDSKIRLAQEQKFSELSITFFVKDEHKSGGEYVNITAKLKKTDTMERCLIMDNGTLIPVEDIIALDIKL